MRQRVLKSLSKHLFRNQWCVSTTLWFGAQLWPQMGMNMCGPCEKVSQHVVWIVTCLLKQLDSTHNNSLMNTRCSQKIFPPLPQSSISERGLQQMPAWTSDPVQGDFFVPGRFGAKRTPSLFILSRCVVSRGLLLCHPCYLETYMWCNYLNCKTFLFLDPMI